MIPATQETGTPQTDLDRKIEQNLLALNLAEPKQNGALYFNLARMADYRDDQSRVSKRILAYPKAGLSGGWTQGLSKKSTFWA